MKLARTSNEAHLSMDLSPCDCGETRFARNNRLAREGSELASLYEGACAGCGAIRRLAFRVERPIRPPASRFAYGGEGASQLIDPGQFLLVSESHARRVPGSASEIAAEGSERAVYDLEISIAALDEVLKFIPAGVDRVPASAFESVSGKSAHDRDPGQFDRLRLEATRAVYAELLRELAAA